MYLELNELKSCHSRLLRETEYLWDVLECLHKVRMQIQEKGNGRTADRELEVSERELQEACEELIKMSLGLEKMQSLFRETEEHLSRVFQGEEGRKQKKEICVPCWKEFPDSEKIRHVLTAEREEKTDEDFPG